MKLLSFELKKIIFSRKFLFLLLLVFIGISFLFIRNIVFQEQIVKEEQKELEELLQANYNNADLHLAELEADPENEKQQKLQRINSSMINKLYEVRNLINTDEWKQQLNLENQYYNELTSYVEAEGETTIPIKEINYRTAMNQKLVDEDIMPQHDRYSTALPNFLKQIVSLFINAGAIILMLLMIGDMVTGEFENRSVNLLFTQPLNKHHIIMSKFASAITTYLLTMVAVIGFTFLIGFFFGEKGTFDYPVLFEKNGAIQFLTVKTYMLQGLVLISTTIILVITLCFLFSLLIKQTLATLFAVLVTLLSGFALWWLLPSGVMAWVNPLRQVYSDDALLLQDEASWFQSFPAVILLAILLLGWSMHLFKNSKQEG
ncbi:ABC transporter permease [Oceanobacillus kapialis]|uniref:ABC transporter permease n=1 Tax=Oceanobacillus kapialis TaxID=481353 RepID=A0ABW5Q1D1_9BACI